MRLNVNKINALFISQLIPIKSQQLVILIIIANGRVFHTQSAAGKMELSFPKSFKHALMSILAGTNQKPLLLKIVR
jgi:hypothetical protein